MPNLILSLDPGDQVRIGGVVWITYTKRKGRDQIQLAFQAPATVPIERSERVPLSEHPTFVPKPLPED